MHFIYLLTVYNIIYRRGHVPLLPTSGMESKRVPQGEEGRCLFNFSSPFSACPACQGSLCAAFFRFEVWSSMSGRGPPRLSHPLLAFSAEILRSA